MRLGSIKILVLVASLMSGVPCEAAPPPLEMRATFAVTGPATSIPYGWVDFCGRRPEQCNVPRLASVDIKLTPKSWARLDAVNRKVNAAIIPITNFDHWGTMLDHWDYPVDGKGDCKIYALQKRKLLLEEGFPRQALLMTIVRDLHDQGHAILTVRTDHGEFVLDNLSDEVRPWTAPGYRFVKRQSQEDPNVWVSILDRSKPALLSAR